MALRRNLTPREKLLIEADYYNFFEIDLPKAAKAYRALFSLYPKDELGLAYLGAIYRNLEEWEKATECYERVQAIARHNKVAIQNLSFIAHATGQYEKASGIITDNQDVFLEPGELGAELAFSHFCQGRTDQALSELVKARSFNPERLDWLRMEGHVHSILGNYLDAEAAYRGLAGEGRRDEDKLEGRFWLGQLYVLQGRYESCSQEIEQGIKLARDREMGYSEELFLNFKSYLCLLRRDFANAYAASSQASQKAKKLGNLGGEIEALHLRGLCEIEMGKLSDAMRTDEAMAIIIKKIGAPKLLRYCYHLEGEIALSREDWDEGVKLLDKAAETLPEQHFEYDPHASYLESLASALFQRGDLDSARAQYNKVISLTTGRLTAGDSYGRSLYWLGRIYQQKNEPETAKQYLQRFLDVLRNADAGLSEVEEARRRLAAIS